MAVAFVASSQAGNNVNLQNLSLTIPAGASDGDFAVLGWTIANTTTGTSPSGWTQIDTTQDDPSVRSALFYRFLQAGDPGTNVALNTTATQRQSAVMAVYSGVLVATPVNKFVSGVESGTATSHTAPTTAATDVANCVGVEVFSERVASPTSITQPSGTTMRENPNAGAVAGSTQTAIADNLTPLSLGATVGGGSWSGGVSSSSVLMWALALAPTVPPSNWTYSRLVTIG